MAFQTKNFIGNDDVRTLDQRGPFQVIEYQRDLSIRPDQAISSYYQSQMNVRRRQLVCQLAKSPIVLSNGAMQWMVGNVNVETGVKGVGDLLGKVARGSVTGEAAIKPTYTGSGIVVTEATYKNIILLDLKDWNGSVVLDDGLFLACEAHLKHKTVMRSNMSSALGGGEGLFNLGIQGDGIVAVESLCPLQELVEINIKDDVLKIDGNMAIAWSGSLQFTVERSGKSLLGSAASGEGLVNVYRGSGRVLMAPVRD